MILATSFCLTHEGMMIKFYRIIIVPRVKLVKMFISFNEIERLES